MMSSFHIAVLAVNPEPYTLIAMALRHEGYTTSLYADQHRALIGFSLQRPDLILLDLSFDEKPLGIEVLHSIQPYAQTAGIPVWITSGNNYVLRAYNHVFNALKCRCIAKPFRLTWVLQQVHELQELQATLHAD